MNWKKLITPFVCLFLGFALGVSHERFHCRGLPPGFDGPPPDEHFHEGPPRGRPPWAGERMRKHHQRRMQRMRQGLGLSDEQAEKVEAIMEAAHEQMSELREQVHPRFRELREETLAQVRAELSPEQQQKFDEISRKRREFHKERRRQRAGPPGERPGKGPGERPGERP